VTGARTQESNIKSECTNLSTDDEDMKPEENAPIKVEPRVFPEEHAVPYASTTPVRIKEDPVKQENVNPAPIKETPEAISLRRQTNFRSKNNSKLLEYWQIAICRLQADEMS
jgi:hypothetical protein